MTAITAPGSVNALLSALDYARQGIDSGLQSYAHAAQSIASAAGAHSAPPVDALVENLQAKLQVAASAKVLSAVDRTLGTLLDVRA